MALRQKFRIRNSRNISPIFLCKPCKCLRVTLGRKLNKCRRVVCTEAMYNILLYIFIYISYILSCCIYICTNIYISTQFGNRSFIPFPGNYFYLQEITGIQIWISFVSVIEHILHVQKLEKYWLTKIFLITHNILLP